MTQWIKVPVAKLTSILGTHMVDTYIYKMNVIGYLLKGSVLEAIHTFIKNLPYITIFRIQFLTSSE